MSSKLFGAFRETLKVGEGQPLAEQVKGEIASDRPCGINTEEKKNAEESSSQVKRRKKQRRYTLAPN